MAKNCGCKFLYGPETSETEIARIENALDRKTELKTEVLFYRKRGLLTYRLYFIISVSGYELCSLVKITLLLNTSWVSRSGRGLNNGKILYVSPGTPGHPRGTYNISTLLRPVPGSSQPTCEVSALYLKNCANACWIYVFGGDYITLYSWALGGP